MLLWYVFLWCLRRVNGGKIIESGLVRSLSRLKLCFLVLDLIMSVVVYFCMCNYKGNDKRERECVLKNVGD